MNRIEAKYIYGQYEGAGAGILIFNNPIPIIGRILQFTDPEEMNRQILSDTFLTYAQVSGYSILIVYAGILGVGYHLRSPYNSLEAITDVLRDMAVYYHNEKILPHLARFKRYIYDFGNI